MLLCQIGVNCYANMRILEERLRFEEAAFAGLKRDLQVTQKNRKNTREQAGR
jgi:hypothetical protein